MSNNNWTDEGIYNYPEHILAKLEESENRKLEWKYDEALAIAQEIIVENPECIPALEEVADNLLSLWKTKESKKTAVYILKLTDTSYTAYYILGFINSKHNNFTESIKFLQKANEIKPNNAEILRCLWWSLFMNWDKVKWIHILERALNLYPKDIMILCDLAMCNLDVDKIDKSVELISKAKELNPSDERVHETYLILKSYIDKKMKLSKKK